MKKQKQTTSGRKTKDLTHDSIPASVGLVKQVRSELRADIRSLDHKVESLSHRVDSLSHRVDSLGSVIQAVEHRLDSKIEQVVVAVHRTQVLMEEQRGENKIVLDGIKGLIERQDRLETDVIELRDTVRTFGAKA